jgi:hypothetical protein
MGSRWGSGWLRKRLLPSMVSPTIHIVSIVMPQMIISAILSLIDLTAGFHVEGAKIEIRSDLQDP